MWVYRGMLRIQWTDSVINEDIFKKVETNKRFVSEKDI